MNSRSGSAPVTELRTLVDRARSGDADAFGRLFERYHRSIYGLLLRATRSPMLADDCASETFTEALRTIDTFTSDATYFGPWLARIARAVVSEHDRSSRSHLELVTDDMAPHVGATDGPEAGVLGSLGDALTESLALLPMSQRRCLTLRFLQQRTINETARLLGCSEGAVKQLQLRGLRNLARMMRRPPRLEGRSA